MYGQPLFFSLLSNVICCSFRATVRFSLSTICVSRITFPFAFSIFARILCTCTSALFVVATGVVINVPQVSKCSGLVIPQEKYACRSPNLYTNDSSDLHSLHEQLSDFFLQIAHSLLYPARMQYIHKHDRLPW